MKKETPKELVRVQAPAVAPTTGRGVNIGLKRARGKVSTQMIEDLLADMRGEPVDQGSPLVYVRSVIRDPLSKPEHKLRAAEILIGRFIPQQVEVSADEDGPGTLTLSAQRMNIALGILTEQQKERSDGK